MIAHLDDRDAAVGGSGVSGILGVAPATLYRALLDLHPEPTFTLHPDGRVAEANRAFARFVGLPVESLAGQPVTALVLPERAGEAARRVAAAAEGEPQAWRAEFTGPDGTVSIAHVTLAAVTLDATCVALQGVARDVTVYEVMEEQLEARVFTDPLTGLANRTQLHEHAQRAMRGAAAAGVPARVALALVDLDDFKVVNDGLGHTAGDRLLAAVAGRLRAATRGRDLVARLGGDEFAVLLDGVAGPGDGAAVAARLQEALAAPFDVGAGPLVCTASVGVAHWDGAALPAELLRHAGLALWRARQGGKGTHAVFDAPMQAEARDRVELARDLRAAIAAGEVVAHYQPIVDLATGRVVKAEALARWTHPTRGPISPAVFIPLAEGTGQMIPLGAHMLRLACQQLRRWQDDAATRDVGVAVNVSGQQLERGGLVATVREVLAATGADPRGLTLEITESVAMRHPERVLPVLHALVALGVRLAIDDFGTGHSSLAYLHRFPVHVLKIDRSFVEALDAGGEAGAQAWRWRARSCTWPARSASRRWPRGSSGRRSATRSSPSAAASGRGGCSGGRGRRRRWAAGPDDVLHVSCRPCG